MKDKLFEHVGGNQFTLVKGLEPVNEMSVGDAKRKRDFTEIRRLFFGDLLDYLAQAGVKLDPKQESELFKNIADNRSGWNAPPPRPR